MRKLLLPILAYVVLLPAFQLYADSANNQLITMTLPNAVIVEALKRILPLKMNGSASGLEGTITIVDITNFRLKDQHMLCHLDLMGNNLHLVTRVASQEIRLKLGTARVDFDCDATIRYDAARQILFIRPTTSAVRSSNAMSKADIGQALMLLVDGQEFPVSMQNLKPFIAETSDKIITVSTKIVAVRAVAGALELSLAPTVTTARPQGKPNGGK